MVEEQQEVERPPQPTVTAIDAISLPSLGAFLMFGEVNEEMAYRSIDFIVKANILYDPQLTLTLFINSPGGTVSDGFAIIDVMKTSRLPIQTVSTGVIASMGVLIAAAGTKGKRVITKNTEIMTHQFSSMIYGKFHELMAAHKYHERLEMQFLEFFKKNTKMTEKQVRDIIFSPSDRWLTPQEALKYGIVDRISDYLVQEED